MENLTLSFRVTNLGVGACKRKKGAFFVPFILSNEIFLTFVFYLNIQCIDCFFRIYILLHIKKRYFIHFFACF